MDQGASHARDDIIRALENIVSQIKSLNVDSQLTLAKRGRGNTPAENLPLSQLSFIHQHVSDILRSLPTISSFPDTGSPVALVRKAAAEREVNVENPLMAASPALPHHQQNPSLSPRRTTLMVRFRLMHWRT
jgi:hypothetical protein